MEDFGFKFWLKMAGLFVLGAIALFVFMWIFLSAIYAWGFLAAMLVLAVRGARPRLAPSTAGTRVRAEGSV